MVVTFCGHKDAPNAKELSERLNSVLSELIEDGVDLFFYFVRS